MSESIHALIQHQVADLRDAWPEIEAVRTVLERRAQGGGIRYSLSLDIRAPQRQSLVAGPERESEAEAVDAAFAAARERLEETPWARR